MASEVDFSCNNNGNVKNDLPIRNPFSMVWKTETIISSSSVLKLDGPDLFQISNQWSTRQKSKVPSKGPTK